MNGEQRAQGLPLADEGSWAYLIAAAGGRGGMAPLREHVVDACEASGWPAVSWSPAEAGHAADPGHYYEGVRHAVENADFVVVLLGVSSGFGDAELAIAYGYRRPIVGIRVPDQSSPVSDAQAMLESYERARVIAYDDVDRCAAELREVLSDPAFAATVHAAAREHAPDG